MPTNRQHAAFGHRRISFIKATNVHKSEPWSLRPFKKTDTGNKRNAITCLPPACFCRDHPLTLSRLQQAFAYYYCWGQLPTPRASYIWRGGGREGPTKKKQPQDKKSKLYWWNGTDLKQKPSLQDPNSSSKNSEQLATNPNRKEKNKHYSNNTIQIVKGTLTTQKMRFISPNMIAALSCLLQHIP